MPTSGAQWANLKKFTSFRKRQTSLVPLLVSKLKTYFIDNSDNVCFAGLLRLQQLFQSLAPSNAPFRISNVKRVTNASEVVDFLRAIERLDRWSNKYVVLDSSTQLAKDVLISHVRDVQLGRRNYHYFLSGLVSYY